MWFLACLLLVLNYILFFRFFPLCILSLTRELTAFPLQLLMSAFHRSEKYRPESHTYSYIIFVCLLAAIEISLSSLVFFLLVEL